MASIVFSLGYLLVSLTRTQLPSGAVIYSISPAVRWLLSLLSPIAVALAIDQVISGVLIDQVISGVLMDQVISVVLIDQVISGVLK